MNKKRAGETMAQKYRRQSNRIALWVAGIIVALTVTLGLYIAHQASQPKPIRAIRGIEAWQDSDGQVIYVVYLRPFREEQTTEADAFARHLLEKRLKRVAPGTRVSEEPLRRTYLKTPAFGEGVRLEYKVLPPPSEPTSHEAKL